VPRDGTRAQVAIRDHDSCIIYDRYLREKLPYAVELYYPPGSNLARLRLRASAWPELQKNRAEDEYMQTKHDMKMLKAAETLSSTGQSTGSLRSASPRSRSPRSPSRPL
jgi:hypothetical protein